MGCGLERVIRTGERIPQTVNIMSVTTSFLSNHDSRCLLQIHPRSANDGITLPKSFPPLPPAEEEFAQPAFILPDSQLESNAQIVEVWVITSPET